MEGLVRDLCLIPGLSGHEGAVRRHLAGLLDATGIAHRTDRLGNLTARVPGDPAAPSVLLIAHMDQIGMLVRRIESDGLIRVEKIGGLPERALPGQAVLVGDLPGIIGHKSHHATPPEERARPVPLAETVIDAGFASAAEARAAGVEIGTPVVYAPSFTRLAGSRIAATTLDDRAACAVLIAVARAIAAAPVPPTVHLLFSVQEEFNIRGALPAARAAAPDICVQLDLMLATDTPDMAGRGEMRLGAGPGMGLYSFHGRGTLNGLLPHPALVRLAAQTAAAEGIPLQRSVQAGVLTETAYVQIEGAGVACLELGFPCRYAHSPRELCDLADLTALARLVIAMLERIGPGFALSRD